MDVQDQDGYARYREGMIPILGEYGGSFLHDFDVSAVRRSSVDHPVTRLFVLTFPDASAMEGFFSDERYLTVKSEHFVSAVGKYTELGQLTPLP